MAYFKVYETQRLISKKGGNMITVTEDTSFDTNNMLIVTPRCLVFDNEWNRIIEACNFLENRLYVKRQEWNTIEAKMFALKLFYDFLEETSVKLNAVNVKVINEFIAWLFKGKDTEKFVMGKVTERTDKTVNIYISHLRDYFKFLRHTYQMNDPFMEEHEQINRPSSQPKGFFEHTRPTGQVSKSMFKVKERGKKEITILGKTEVQMLINASSLNRDKLMIKLMLYTGMRIGEILNLKILAVSIPDMTIDAQQIRMIPSTDDGKRRKLKTGKRDVFLPPWLMKELDSYFNDTWLKLVDAKGLKHDYFFISEGNRNRGKPLSYNGVKSRFTKLFESTGINVNPHDFRHTYATNLARLKIDVSTMMEMLGHSNPASIAIYIKAAKIEEISETLAEFYREYDIGIGEKYEINDYCI